MLGTQHIILANNRLWISLVLFTHLKSRLQNQALYYNTEKHKGYSNWEYIKCMINKINVSEDVPHH